MVVLLVVLSTTVTNIIIPVSNTARFHVSLLYVNDARASNLITKGGLQSCFVTGGKS